MAEALTPEISVAARGLGAIVATHRRRIGPRLGRIVAGATAMVIGVGVVGLGFALARVQMFAALFFIAVGSGLAITGGIGIDRTLSAMRMRVVLFEGGFVWADDVEARGFRWDHIATVHLIETRHRSGGQVIYRTHSFEVTARDGRVVWLEDGDLCRGEELGQAIVRAVRDE